MYKLLLPFVDLYLFYQAEIISAFPLAGGVYSWSFLLANKKWGPCKYCLIIFFRESLTFLP